MRYLPYALCFSAVLLAASCADSKWAFIRNNRTEAQVPAEIPKAPDLVNYLNQNAQRIESIECPYLDLDIKQGSGLAVQQWGMRGKMVCEKPRNFRLVAEVLGKYEADIGSNKDEFWYWIARDNPPLLVHCSYADLERGVKIPFPFQPEWVMEALGIGSYDQALNYRVVPQARTLELVTETVSQGKRVQKVTVFNRAPSRVQVRDHILRDARGQEICSAHILDAQNINGTMVPREMVLSYPAEKLELKMRLFSDGRDISVNRPLDRTGVFQRPNLTGVRTLNLGSGLDDNGHQVLPAGAFQQQR